MAHGDGAVAFQAEGAHVVQAALAAAGGNGDDVVGVPEVAARAPVFFELAAGSVVELALVLAELLRIDAAQGADAAVAREDLLAEVAGVGAQLPFVDAGGGAESEAAFRNGLAAPPAGGRLLGRAALDPSTGFRSAGAHCRKL